MCPSTSLLFPFIRFVLLYYRFFFQTLCSSIHTSLSFHSAPEPLRLLHSSFLHSFTSISNLIAPLNPTFHTQAFTPVAILLISWVFRLSEPSRKLLLIVLMISSGVALASKGERWFSLIGFMIQAGGVGVSSVLLFGSSHYSRPILH
jgi:hypothetical protein